MTAHLGLRPNRFWFGSGPGVMTGWGCVWCVRVTPLPYANGGLTKAPRGYLFDELPNFDDLFTYDEEG